MKALRRRWLLLGPLLGGAALLWSCVAPILTVPPPSAIAFTKSALTDSSGAQYWVASGPPLPQAANAVYYIRNEMLGQGVIVTGANDGSFATSPPLPGNPGDHVLVDYQTPYGDYSDSACFVLPAAAGSAGLCP
ncbi:MAG TPA: hypothetical protein VN853_10395 [Polyangia bacterium]|jgi:hypothetical protein|nr:hypothetical protein [Polyangia bacterium]